MKRVSGIFLLAVFLTVSVHAQFKSQVAQEDRVSGGMVQDASPSLIFGWFNPEKFHMRHSLSFSYLTMGGQGMSMGTYTNSMMYEIADNLQARADVSLNYTPNSSFAQFGGQKASSLSSLYLSRAELNYKPWENVFVQVQFRQTPYGYYSPFMSPFGSPWYREDGF